MVRHAAATMAVGIIACSTNASQDPAAGTAETFTGEWQAEFTLDSVRSADSLRTWSSRNAPAARGTIRFPVTVDEREEHDVTMTVDFRPLLGRQMSCYEPGPLTIQVMRIDSASWTLLFTPRVADCGFAASARRVGDTLRGEWSETSLIGPIAQGRLQMMRR